MISTASLVATMLLFSLPLHAQELTAQYVLEKVQEKYSTMNDASAQFVQKTILRFAKKEQVQSGSVKVKKGNKYRVETGEQLLMTDGTTVWIVSRANNQVLIDHFNRNKRVFSPEKFLTGLPNDFEVKRIQSVDGVVNMLLEPKVRNAQTRNIRSLTAWIKTGTWVIEKIEYLDLRNNRIEIALSAITFNQQIHDSEFTYVPPQGMKIVDMRAVQ